MLRFCIELGFSDGIPRLVESSAVAREVDTLFAIRGTKVQYEVQFSRLGVLELLPVGSLLRYTAKLAGKYDGPAQVTLWDADWTTPGTAAGYYTGTCDYDTTELETSMLSPDAIATNDVAAVTLMGAFSWGLVGVQPTETKAFDVEVSNLINNEGTSAATSAGIHPTPISALAGYTGGGATKLDGIATVSMTVGRLILFIHPTDGLVGYYLRAEVGTEAESSPLIILPDDHVAITNAKVWVKVL